MNYKMILRMMSFVMLIESAAMSIPAIIAAFHKEAVMPFIYTMLALVVLSLPGLLIRTKNTRLYAKDGFACVSCAWLLMSLFGALPFVLSGAIPNLADAFFETVSGFTTTGASILSDIEALPRGILFWRSETHWIGGMGVLVLMLAILPSGGSSMHLLRAEVPGPTKGKVAPRMRDSSMILYGIYIILTVVMTLCLRFSGLSLYDSLVSTLATAGTGGFSVLNTSIAGYGNPAAEWVITVFMFLFGVNFNIYFLVIVGKFREIFRNEEIRAYTAIAVTATGLVFINLCLNCATMFSSVTECIRAASFQTMSIMSTTGFTTVNYDLWPSFSKTVIVILMILGACGGSTAGGLKTSRVLILFKSMVNELKHMLHPNSVNVIKLDGKTVSDETVKGTKSYFCIYCSITALSVLLLSLNGFDFETNTTAVLSCINNVGPGLGRIIGPVGNFGSFSVLSKLLLSLDMLLGRLEIMPLLMIAAPSSWKRR